MLLARTSVFLARNKQEGLHLSPCAIHSWFKRAHLHTIGLVTALLTLHRCHSSGPSNLSVCVMHILGSKQHIAQLICYVINQTDPEQHPGYRDVEWVKVFPTAPVIILRITQSLWVSGVSLYSSTLVIFLVIFKTHHALQWGLFLPNSFLSSLLSISFQCYPVKWEQFHFPEYVENILVTKLVSHFEYIVPNSTS